MSEPAKEKIERLAEEAQRHAETTTGNATVCALRDEALRLVNEAEKTAPLQEASRFYRVCDACSTSSFEPTPDGERCGMCYVKAENKRLTEENTGLQRMITCEHTGRVECARDKPNPPDKILSRCYSCQITLAKLKNASLRQFATKNASKVETLVGCHCCDISGCQDPEECECSTGGPE